jgi:hypothetical protein
MKITVNKKHILMEGRAPEWLIVCNYKVMEHGIMEIGKPKGE